MRELDQARGVLWGTPMRCFPRELTPLCVALALALCFTGCTTRTALPSAKTSSAIRASPRAATVGERVAPASIEEPSSVSKSLQQEPNSNWTELDEAVDGVQTLDEALPLAAAESEFSCAALANALNERVRSGVTSQVAHLRVTNPERLWASVGPEPLAARLSGRSLLLLARIDPTDQSSSPIACAPSLGLDLQPGEYFIYGATRVSHSYFPATGLMYRVSPSGDRTCPRELAARGISDWNGDFPISFREAGDLDGDGASDLAIDYQYAFVNPGTRLLVARPYPTCYRIVMDEAASVQLLGSRTHGWRDVAYSYWSLHPVEFFGGRMSVNFAGQFDAELERYTPTRFQRCADGFPGGGADTRQRERLCNQHYRATLPRSIDDLTEEWLSSAPSQRATWQIGELGRQLLQAIDEQGLRFDLEGADECPTAAKTRRFTVNLKLRASTDDDKTWTRALFVNWELAPRDDRPRLSGISEASPCPFAEEAPDALSFVESWAQLSGPKRAKAVHGSLATVHAALQQAQARGRVESPSVRSCTSDPGNPTWLWSALLDTGSEKDPHRPMYLLLGRSGGNWQVLRSSPIAPAQCPLG